MLRYETLSDALVRQMAREKQEGTFARVGVDDRQVIRRRRVEADEATIWRPPFVHDVDKILHCPYYNRYID